MAGKSLVIPLPIGPDGLTGNLSMATVSPNEALDARNMCFYYGTQRKEGGTTKYGTLPDGNRVLGGHDWWPTAGNQRMICLSSGGTVYRDTGAGTFPTTLVAGLNMSGVVIPYFVECGQEAAGNNRKLVMFTPNNAPQVLSGDGVTMTALKNPPSDWTGTTQPPTGCVAQGRLWGGLKHLGYYSYTSDHETFAPTATQNDTAGTIPVFPGEGEGIVACCAFKGHIIWWKQPWGIYYTDVSQPVPFGWSTHRISSSVGIDSPNAFAITDNDICFTWNGNPYLISALSEAGNFRNADLGATHWLRPWLTNNVNLNRVNRVQAMYYADHREFQWTIAGAGATKNTLRLTADFNRPDTARFRYSDLVTCESIWMRKDVNLIPRPMGGDDVGVVRALDVDARSVDGSTGYTSRIQTPHDDFARMQNAYLGTWGLPARRKNGQWLEIIMEPKGNWNVSCDIYWDGKYRQTVQYNMGVNGAALGSFVLGTSALAGQSVASKRHRIVGSGRRFSCAFYNSGAGQDFSLAAAYLGVTLGDDRPGTTS